MKIWTDIGECFDSYRLRNHLFQVKNKKRWSQVMYMSYVLDFREKGIITI